MKKKELELFEEDQNYSSKFIISPENYWNMLWNNLVICNFIIYVMIIPLVVSFNPILDTKSLHVLLIFDIVFLMDRILDLFVGYLKPDGTEETILWCVILKNLN